jgi:hypothetical protein
MLTTRLSHGIPGKPNPRRFIDILRRRVDSDPPGAHREILDIHTGSATMEFNLRRARDRGKAIGSARVHEVARGRLFVVEAKDETLRRVVRTATFERVDGGDPVPSLRDVVLLGCKPDWLTLTGFEEIADDRLADPRLYQQTWQLEPAALGELEQAERTIGRLIARLAQLGVVVQISPDRSVRIEGEASSSPDTGPGQ